MKKITILLLMAVYLFVLFVDIQPVSAQTTDKADEYKRLVERIIQMDGSNRALNYLSSSNPQDSTLEKALSKGKELQFKYRLKSLKGSLTLAELKEVAAFYETASAQKYVEAINRIPWLMGKDAPGMDTITLNHAYLTFPAKDNVDKEHAVLLKRQEIRKQLKEKRRERDQRIYESGHVVPMDSIHFAENIPFDRSKGTMPWIYSIERRKNDTKVTFVQPIYSNWLWLHYGAGFRIVDKEHGDEYHVRGYADGFPFGHNILIIKNCNKKNIFVSLLFPKLKKNVKVVDILELLHPSDTLPSNDDGVQKDYFDVKVKDYPARPQGTVYL